MEICLRQLYHRQILKQRGKKKKTLSSKILLTAPNIETLFLLILEHRYLNYHVLIILHYIQYQMKGPHPVLCRGACSNYTSFSYDVRAAWQNALMWYITRNQSHWDRATTILDAWGSNLTDVIGTDTALLVSLDGDLLVNAAEIMRWEGGWDDGSFSNQLYWLFARQSIIIGQANYGLATIKGLLSFAVYLDDVSMVSVRGR